MIFQSYNLVNQKLDSDEMVEVLQYCSKKFAGSIGPGDESPFSISGTSATLKSPCTLLVDGMLFKGSDGNFTKSLSTTGKLMALIINIGKIKENTNIMTNVVSDNDYIIVDSITGFTSNNGINVVTSEDGVISILDSDGETGWEVFNNDSKMFSSYFVGASEAPTGSYYIVPLAYYDGSNLVSLFKHFTLDDFEQFLTEQAVALLKQDLDSKYVWRVGGESVGDIGQLNITGNTIKNTSSNTIKISSPYICFDELAKRLNIIEGQAYPLWIEKSGNISAKYRNLPISMGGTGADTWNDARRNFNIYCGTVSPESWSLSSSVPDWTIYLKVIK